MSDEQTPQTEVAATKEEQALARLDSQGATRLSFNESSGFALMQRVAMSLTKSSLVPAEYRNNIANCIVALDLANRIGASPLMVMQNLYIVNGKPGWSSAFLIACVNQSGRFGPLQYEWSGTQGHDDWACRAWAIDKSTQQRAQGPAVSFGMAKKEGWVDKKGSKWQTMPELMMTYRAATFFARTNAPELTMGLQTADELQDTIETTQVSPGVHVPVSDVDPLDSYLFGVIETDAASIREAVAKVKMTKGQLSAKLKQFAGNPAELLKALTPQPEKVIGGTVPVNGSKGGLPNVVETPAVEAPAAEKIFKPIVDTPKPKAAPVNADTSF